MKRVDELPRQDLENLNRTLSERYEAFRERGLKLDLTRGKPSPEQLDLSATLLDGMGDDFRPRTGRTAETTGS